MKYSYLKVTILHLFFFGNVSAQNLVPNAGFEIYNNCPSNLISMPYSFDYSFFPTVSGWTTPVRLTTPDYLNDCAPASSGLKVPQTSFGYQMPYSGNAYAGIIAFQGRFTNGSLTHDYREYLQTKLSQPMIAGKQYCVRFHISPTVGIFNYNYVALDELGIHFSDTRRIDTANTRISLPYHIQNTPGGYLTDTNIWYRITGVYTASGGEEWLTLGTFFNGNAPSFIPITPAVPDPNVTYWSYFFVDDVTVAALTAADTIRRRWDTTVCTITGLNRNLRGAGNAKAYRWQDGSATPYFTANDTGVYWCAAMMECGMVIDSFYIRFSPNRKLDLGRDTANCLGQPITIGTNVPFNSYHWNTGDRSPTITVTESGTYILIAADTCGIHSDTIEVAVQPPTDPPVVRDTTICQFVSTPLLNVEGSNLTWYYPNSGFGFPVQPYIMTDKAGMHTFYVTQRIGKCESPKVPVNIRIQYKPDAEIGDFHTICAGRDTLIGQHIDSVTFLWNTGERVCCIIPRQTGTYELTITNECGSSSDTAFVEIYACDDCIFIPNAFTPNGDGRNDLFSPILKCAVYNYQLKIFNRWGENIFSATDPASGWNGRYKGERADMGSYIYLVEYNSAITKSRKTFQGTVTLIR